MSRVRVLDVGNCDPDHGRIRALLTEHFDVDVDRVMFVPEACAALTKERYALALVNRLIFADDSPGMALVDWMATQPQRTPLILVSNYPDAQAAAVARGALPGFGKAQLNEPETLARLAALLPLRRSTRSAG